MIAELKLKFRANMFMIRLLLDIEKKLKYSRFGPHTTDFVKNSAPNTKREGYSNNDLRSRDG